MVKLISKNSNLCDHNSPTSQTDGRTDRRHTVAVPRCAVRTYVLRAVKTLVGNFIIATSRREKMKHAIRGQNTFVTSRPFTELMQSVDSSSLDGRQDSRRRQDCTDKAADLSAAIHTALTRTIARIMAVFSGFFFLPTKNLGPIGRQDFWVFLCHCSWYACRKGRDARWTSSEYLELY